MPVRRALTPLLVVIATILPSSCGFGHQPAAVEAHAKDAAPIRSHVSFAPGEGWQTVETKLAPPESYTPVAWTANVPFSDEDAGREFPTKSIEGLPSGGIVIAAVGPRPYMGEAEFPHLDLPLKLSDGRLLSGSYEGQPAPTLSYFFVDAWIGDQLLNVWGYFGENPPSAAIQAEADRALGTLRAPR